MAMNGTGSAGSGLAIVFDLDGTLVDSVGDIVGAANRLLAEEGRPTLSLDQGRAMVGEGAAALVERAFAVTGPEPGPEALAELVTRYRVIYERYPLVETTVYPGVTETLTELAEGGAIMGVCTNKPHDISLVVLAELGLDGYFAAALGGDALDVRKPDPVHLTSVLDAMGAGSRRAIHVGDSPTDVAVARNAGVPVIAVSYGYSRVAPADLDADVLIHEFSALPGAIASIHAGD
jgi:phosphoglycolate phosphatase